MKKVSVISTGSELVNGFVRDSNSFFLSRELFPTPFRVVLQYTAGDVSEELEYVLREAMGRTDIVLISGGLGPTDDDLTLEVLGKILGFPTLVYEPGRRRMEAFFRSLGGSPLKNDIKMVTVPEGSRVFDNEVGLAAGFALRQGDRTIIAMPGVPREMEPMFVNKVLPFLMAEYKLAPKRHLLLRTILMREAEVNEMVTMMGIPLDDVEWGITTKPGMNILTFVQKEGRDFPEESIIREFNRAFGDRMLAPGFDTLEAELFFLLKRKGLRLALAESCTGGLAAKRITDIPGSSYVFAGGIVAYSNQAKLSLLGVSEQSLKDHGAVSEAVAAEMASGVRDRFQADIGASITGVAGPGGGTAEKPVGMVCFGFAGPEGVVTMTRMMQGDRERVRLIASQYALNRVRLYLKGLP